MLRQQAHFEWYIVDESPSWQRLLDEDVPIIRAGVQLTNAEHRFAMRLLHAVAVLLVAMATLSSVGQTPAERDRIRATAGIEAALAREIALDPDEHDEPDPRLLAVKPAGEVVLAEVLIHGPARGWRLSSPYRETRFYRETEQSWVQTAPAPAFWGGKHYLETDHLRFEYYARDAAIVQSIAAKLDRIYRIQYEILGLDIPSSTEKLTTIITPFPVNGRGVYVDRIEVASPLLSLIPKGLSAADYLTHRLTSRFLYRVVDGVGDDRFDETNSYRWRTLRRGLRRWLQTELVGQRWPWDQEGEDLLRQNSDWQNSLQLTDHTGWSGQQPLDREGLMWQYAVAETVIAYAVDTYGQEYLPKLLRGFRGFGTWRELTFGVFGVSTEEFETGWNRYLLETYGLDSVGEKGLTPNTD